MTMAIIIIVLVLGVVVSNIMLLKHTAKFNWDKFNQDPLEKAKDQLNSQKLAHEVEKTADVGDDKQHNKNKHKDS